MNKVVLTYSYISALVGILGKIVTSVHEYEQDKSICKYLILFLKRNNFYSTDVIYHTVTIEVITTEALCVLRISQSLYMARLNF